ncbi:chemotaxis protein CheW [Bdellovibrio bacteriovorus]|uniref:chemotaxis protein CheA n=1 Tax=Bdellovibrio bacteriovorus TaxID=959 RepID=UPI0021CEBE3E|nr:ATP-binding protein [Bdellovibrio bacteriovorus]UXR64887.1 chemotaxis protein CheW [Bdellovibrio bacteriovorus]
MSDDTNELDPSQQEGAVFIDFEQVEEVSRAFFEESKEILEDLDSLILKLEAHPQDQDQLNILFRKIHTLKGSVGAVPGGQLLGSLSHEFEALLTRIKRESRPVTKDCVDIFLKSSRILKVLAQSLREKREVYPEELSEAIEVISSYGSFSFENETSSSLPRYRDSSVATHTGDDAGVWLSTNQLNEFLRLSGELLVLKNFFQMMNQTVNFRVQPEVFERRQGDFAQNLGKICDQFQNQVQVVRKEKASDSLQALPVLVRQASTELNKNVHLEVDGSDLLIDKGLGKDLYECLVHLIRNSIDHGIEDQFERALQGKNSIGTLHLQILEKSGAVHAIFKDDGKGLDKDRILQRAVKNALVTAEAAPQLSEDEIYKFIFQAGFSTKDKVTTISGRGVGMDVVQAIVDKYHGRITVENHPGMGATFHLELPIPQHIMVESALLCLWGDYQFAVPLSSVAHITSCEELNINTVQHLRYCQFSGLTVPFMNYEEILNMNLKVSDEVVRRSSAVFIRVKDQVLALMVDRIEAQTDLVVKSFGNLIREQKGFKGISILADEKVTYIVDPEKMFALLALSETQREAA